MISKESKIAVIITSHNRCDQTRKCLTLLRNENIELSVYLTDDGSTDGTNGMIKSNFPDVHLINGDGNLFWTRGMHKAFDEALVGNHEYFLWLNDDTAIVAGFLEKLINVSRKYIDKAIICGATVSNEDKSKLTYGGYSSTIDICGVSAVDQECAFASANILLIPSEIAKVVGNLDDFYQHALGDFDYEGRARKLGFKIIQAAGYYGFCERHESIPKWRDVNYPLSVRLKHLYSPLGRPPRDFWHYDKKIYGINKALFHYFTLHLRCVFPKLWGKRYGERE